MPDLPDSVHIAYDDDGPVMMARLGFDGLVAAGFSDSTATGDAAALLAGRPGLDLALMTTFDAARSVSSRGAVAIHWVDLDIFVRFAVRLEEAGNEFPTLAIEVDGLGRLMDRDAHDAVTRLGSRSLRPGSFLWWSRFDIIDHASSLFVDDDEPFVGWVNGSPLYELRREGASEIWFGEEPVLGPFGSADGSLAFFTDPRYAQHFAETFRGKMRIVLRDPVTPDPSWQLVVISDLNQRLSVHDHLEPTSVVINPGAPRTMIGVVHRSVSPLIRNTRGLYRLLSGNRLVFQEPATRWDGYGTLHYSGGSAFAEQPLGRSFAIDPMAGIVNRRDNMTELELDEVTSAFLDSTSDATLSPAEACQRPLTEVFLISAWDTVTGLRAVESFDSFPGALAWLVHHELHSDRPSRIGGAAGCWQLGFAGSEDGGAEAVMGRAFRDAIHAILLRAARDGYSPDDTKAVISLCNAVLKSIHVETLGYCADLAWRLSTEQGQIESLEQVEGFPLEPGEMAGWLSTVSQEPDPSQLVEVRNRLGAATELLEPKSRLFLATAFGDWASRGNSPLMDYSPVSIGVVKALETELVAVITAFANLDPAPSKTPVTSDNDRILQEFFNDRSRRPTIGQMRHLLKSPDGALHRKWIEFVETLPEGRELRSSRFREFLHKASSHYRNGGAHDSAVALDVAEACIGDIVGNLGAPGRLSLVAAAKHSARSTLRKM